MRWLATFAILLITADAGFGQQRWQGLVLGSSLNQVEQMVVKKGWRIQRLEGQSMRFNSLSGHQEYEATPDYDVEPSTIKIPLHFTPNLLFAPADQLQRVTLNLNTKQHNEEQLTTGALTLIAAKAVQAALVERYGPPLARSGICDSVSAYDIVGRGTAECKLSWKAEKQRISLEWFHSGYTHQLFLSISYERIVASGV